MKKQKKILKIFCWQKKINILKDNNKDIIDKEKEEVVHRRIVKIKKSS